MQLLIEIDENVFTRLFDNGIEDHEMSKDDIPAMATALRNAKTIYEKDNDLYSCNTCKYGKLDPKQQPCNKCCHCYINQYVYDDTRESNTSIKENDDEVIN